MSAVFPGLYYAYYYSQICCGIETYSTIPKSNLKKVQILQNKIIKVLVLYNKDWLTPTNNLHKDLNMR